MTDLLSLAHRIETEEPSHALCEDIARALGYSPGAGRLWWTPDRTGMTALPDWLTSIDAAAALMPEAYTAQVIQYGPTLWMVEAFGSVEAAIAHAEAPTEPRARTAAALRAIEAEK